MTPQTQQNKRVLIFGTFDRFHEGHEAFLKQAHTYGDQLIVCLPSDELVELFKNHAPRQRYQERRDFLAAHPLVSEVIQSDPVPGTYDVIRRTNPDVIAFGYDQNELKESVETWLKQYDGQIETVVLNPYKPEQYKSSLQSI